MQTFKKIELSGVVQGVGFRPFVYQLAHRYELSGFVQNNTTGVRIEIEGTQSKIEMFMNALLEELPPLARIDSMHSNEGSVTGCKAFNILQSEEQEQKTALISPDISVCEKCLSEMNDPLNRRFNYPFINCTDCGPRYSIMKKIPYDRPNTSMNDFQMCKACASEYADPHDRRFHAQPISCFACGPKVSLLDRDANLMGRGSEAIGMAAKAILEGKLVAIKGLGGFHLLCDATNAEAVSLLRERKNRPAKPFALMFGDIESLKQCALVSPEEEAFLTSKEKPIIITAKRKDSVVCEEVAPQIERIGVFLSYTPLHHLLLKGIGRPVVATSANLRNEPIISDAETILKKLGHLVDFVLDHDREIVNSSDDSVMQMISGKPLFLRMARGYAPKSMRLPFKSKKNILALGANQKNTISLIFGDTLIISPHIGDLNSIEAFEYFERTVETFKSIYEFRPELIVCDKHPHYETTKWAHRLKEKDASLSLIEVQHHHAHLLAAKAEHCLSGKVLGFAFDGTGYGDNKVNSEAREGALGYGTIWGAEVMIADEYHYERLYSLRPFRLLGGDKAVKEPRRSALSLLFEYYTLDEVAELRLDVVGQFSKDELKLLHQVWKKGLNAPYASSMGRLFDAVASLCGLVHTSSFEGESGLMMEGHVDSAITKSFDFSIKEGIIDLEKMVYAIITMEDTKAIVTMFFNTLIEIIVEISMGYPNLPLLFSGGVFQNRVLLEKLQKRFSDLQRPLYFQQGSAVNDGGISLGQAWFALYQTEKNQDV